MSLQAAMCTILAYYCVLTYAQFWTTQIVRVPSRATLLLLISSAAGCGLAWTASHRSLTAATTCGYALVGGVALGIVMNTTVGETAGVQDAAYLLASPLAGAWAVFGPRPRLLTAVVITALCCGLVNRRDVLAVEQTVATLASVVVAYAAASKLRAGAIRADRRNDDALAKLVRNLTDLTNQQVHRRARRIMHDEVITALRIARGAGESYTWDVVRRASEEARSALTTGAASPESVADLVNELRSLDIAGLDVRVTVPARTPSLPRDVCGELVNASAEALRNTAAHAEVSSADVIVHTTAAEVSSEFDAVTVEVRDRGRGYDEAVVRGDSRGIADSIRGRMLDIGGSAEVTSRPGVGTTVRLRWSPQPEQPVEPAQDALDWARELLERPSALFAGYVMPPLIAYIVLFTAHWGDQATHVLAGVSFAGLVMCTLSCLRPVSQLKLGTRRFLLVSVLNALFTFTGCMSIQPGVTNAFAFWAAGLGAFVPAAVVLARGPRAGATALALDVGALCAALVSRGGNVGAAGLVGAIGAPVVAFVFAYGHRRAFEKVDAALRALLDHDEAVLRAITEADAARAADDRALHAARAIALPLLEVGCEPTPPSSLEVFRRRAQHNLALVRHALTAPGLVDATAADVLATRPDVSVWVSAPALTPAQQTVVRDLMLAVLRVPSTREISIDIDEDHAAKGVTMAARPGLPLADLVRRQARELGGRSLLANDRAVLLAALRANPSDDGSPHMGNSGAVVGRRR